MARLTTERLAAVCRSLMVVHGAALGVLVSLIGSAVEHPVLFQFLSMPILCSCGGFTAALFAYYYAEFDPPPDNLLTRFLAWLPAAVSAIAVLATLGTGAEAYGRLFVTAA